MTKIASESTAKAKAGILATAMTLAGRDGFQAVTRDKVAAAAGISGGAVNYHWGTIGKLQRAMVQEAIDTRNVKILAGALAAGHALAKSAPDDLKKLAARFLCQ